MMALTFMSIGATLPFLKEKTINLSRLPGLITLTLMGSGIGAGLLLIVPSKALPKLVSIFMIVVVIFSFFNYQAGVIPEEKPSSINRITGYFATFICDNVDGSLCGIFSDDLCRSDRHNETCECFFLSGCYGYFRLQ
jgi:uncharacterized membrane protein YfcA